MQRKTIYIAVGAVALLAGGYVYMKRKSVAATSTAASLPSNNAAVSAQTANPNLVVVNPNGSNGQGNYGMSSNSTYSQALAAESALSGQLAAANSGAGTT